MTTHFHGAIWAQSRDGIIGDGARIPWHLPEDLAHFKATTTGCPVLMGRGTWESLNPRFRPLPGRENIVLSSRTSGEWSAGATVIDSLDAAPDSAWVIGGGEVYRACLPLVDLVVVTEIDAHLAADIPTAVSAPSLDSDFTVTDTGEWHTSERGRLLVGHAEPLRYRVLTYRRITS